MRHTTIILSLLASLLLTLGARTAEAADETPAQKRIADTLLRLRGDLEAPGRTVAEVARHLGTPARALAFVRDEVAFVPYRGSWHDADTTLRLRAANATDKAVLLRALLQAMQQETRLVRAPWPAGAQAATAAPRFTSENAILVELNRQIAGTPEQERAAGDRAQLKAEVSKTRAVIEAQLEKHGLLSRLEGVSEDAASLPGPLSWAWVQRRLPDGTYEDLDPTLPGRARPSVGATPFSPQPASATVRVLAGDKAIVTWTGRAATLFGHDAQVLFVPDSKDPKAAERPEKVHMWRPQLRIGSVAVNGDVFSTRAVKAAPAPSLNPFARRGKKAAVVPAPIRLEVRFEDADPATTYGATFGREIMRFDEGFDPQQLVSMYRVGAGVGVVPFQVSVIRQIDELLDLRDLRRGVDLNSYGKSRAERGLSARTARVLNTLAVVLPGLLSKQIDVVWQGPAVVAESVSLATAGDKLEARTRIDVWHQAFGPAANTPRSLRMEWGIATLALEGHLVRGASVNELLTANPTKLEIVDARRNRKAVPGDEIASTTLAEGGLVLRGAHAPGMTWSIRPNGDLLGTLHTAGTTAKGGESRSQTAGRGFAALGGAALGSLGSPAGMLVGGIAGYLNELSKAYGGATRVLDALGDTIATGDDRYILEAIGKYRSDFARQMTQALAEGLVRGYLESAATAGLSHVVPGTGSLMGDRLVDGAIAGALAYPKDLPDISDAIHGAANILMR